MQSLKGQCFCGQVQFRISPPESAPPVHRLPTHTAVIVASQLTMLKGELHALSWGEGASWQECRRCRTRLFYRQPPGEEIYVQLGAIRDRLRCRNLRLPDWLPVGPAPLRLLKQFHRATQSGQFSKVRRLLNLGLPVDAEVGGQTALEIAAHHGRLRICRLLLKRGADVRRALRHAWQSLPADQLRPRLRLLLDHGYPAQDLLLFAIDSGALRALALILRESVDLNRLDEEGKTLLERASGSPSLLRLLLKHGVDTSLVGRDGWHALGVCAHFGMARSVRTLLEGGFPPDLALHGAPGASLRSACSRGNVEIVRLLLQSGANPNLADEGETPLMLACQQGSLAIVEMLLEAGADAAARDDRGRTAVDRVQVFLPDLLGFARQRAEGWPGDEPVRHRWTKNSAGEFRLKVHKGDRCRAWTDGHAAIAHRLDSTAPEPILRERANPQPCRGNFPLDGGCDCGALRFRLHAPIEPEPVPAILSKVRMVGVRESQLEILSGQDSLYILIPEEDTSNWWRCSKCRQRKVIFQTPEAPGCLYIPVKYLDDPLAAPENLYRTAPLQPCQQALHWAAAAGDTPRVARLLAKGWPVDVEIDGWTTLQKASNSGAFRTSRLLLSHGADARKATVFDGSSSLDDLPGWMETLIQYGYTPQKMLGQVVEYGTPAAVRVLLRAGADLKQPDDEGVHALLLASHNGCAMLRFIMRADPDPVLQSGGLHALGFCAVFGYSGRARALLRSGFPVNLCEGDGECSALISACGAGLYPGFGEWSGPGVFSSTAAPEEDSYHAMLIVGYDDARGAFRVQNSWGNGWGDGGYIWLAYDTFQRTVQKRVFLATSYERSAPALESTGALLSSAGGPAGQITSVVQDQFQGEQSMVLRYRFDEAVTVTNVTVGLADQALNVLVRNGTFYWIRRDGHSYPTGPRAVTILARARDGRPLTYTGSVNVPELTGVTPADPPAQEAGSNGQDPP